MNIIIADSGSTKTQWALVAGAGSAGCAGDAGSFVESVASIVTSGLNPALMGDDEIEERVRREFSMPGEARDEGSMRGATGRERRTAGVTEREHGTAEVMPGGVDALYFYGAGCIPTRREAVAEVLRRILGAREVVVESDLSGAARGLLGRRPGVACILGTGSNSALYDGREIVQNVRPLGYILGDEGSGADLGKRLTGNLLKGLLPDETAAAFRREYSLEYAEIIENVYRRPAANRFLAGFAPFLSRHIDLPGVREIVEGAFEAFVERNLLQYNDIKNIPVSFVGSVAVHFEEQLREVLGRYGMTVGKIEKTPIDGLIRYHTSTH